MNGVAGHDSGAPPAGGASSGSSAVPGNGALIPVPGLNLSGRQCREHPAPLWDALWEAFPHNIMPEGIANAVQRRVRRRLRQIAEAMVAVPGCAWQPLIEDFAIAGLERIHKGYGTNPWFWVVDWPEVLGAAAVELFAVGTHTERWRCALECCSGHFEAMVMRAALSDFCDPSCGMPEPAVLGLRAIGQSYLPALMFKQLPQGTQPQPPEYLTSFHGDPPRNGGSGRSRSSSSSSNRSRANGVGAAPVASSPSGAAAWTWTAAAASQAAGPPPPPPIPDDGDDAQLPASAPMPGRPPPEPCVPQQPPQGTVPAAAAWTWSASPATAAYHPPAGPSPPPPPPLPVAGNSPQQPVQGYPTSGPLPLPQPTVRQEPEQGNQPIPSAWNWSAAPSGADASQAPGPPPPPPPPPLPVVGAAAQQPAPGASMAPLPLPQPHHLQQQQQQHQSHLPWHVAQQGF